MWVAAMIKSGLLTTSQIGWLASSELALIAITTIVASAWKRPLSPRYVAAAAAALVMGANLTSMLPVVEAIVLGRLLNGLAMGVLLATVTGVAARGEHAQRKFSLMEAAVLLLGSSIYFTSPILMERYGIGGFFGFVVGVAMVAILATRWGLPRSSAHATQPQSGVPFLRLAPLLGCLALASYVMGMNTVWTYIICHEVVNQSNRTSSAGSKWATNLSFPNDQLILPLLHHHVRLVPQKIRECAWILHIEDRRVMPRVGLDSLEPHLRRRIVLIEHVDDVSDRGTPKNHPPSTPVRRTAYVGPHRAVDFSLGIDPCLFACPDRSWAFAAACRSVLLGLGRDENLALEHRNHRLGLSGIDIELRTHRAYQRIVGSNDERPAGIVRDLEERLTAHELEIAGRGAQVCPQVRGGVEQHRRAVRQLDRALLALSGSEILYSEIPVEGEGGG